MDNKGLKKEKYQELFLYINNDLTLSKHGHFLKKTEILEKELKII
jgi:hypothetical protein